MNPLELLTPASPLDGDSPQNALRAASDARNAVALLSAAQRAGKLSSFSSITGNPDSVTPELTELYQFLLSDYYAFATHGVGNTPDDFDGFADPGVIHWVDWYGQILQDWIVRRSEQRTFRKVALIIPRECMKSTIGTQTGPYFLNQHIPDIAMAVSSATMEAKPSALEFAAGIASHYELRNEKSLMADFYRAFGIETLAGRTWRSNKMISALRRNTTRRDPTLGVFSVQTGGTSGHYDAVWLDDPITKEQVARYGNTWYDAVWNHYLSLGYVVRKDGIFTLIMTRYGERDLMGRIIETEIAPVVRDRVQRGAPRGQLPSDFRTQWHRYAHLAGWEVKNMSAEFDEEGNRKIMFPVIWPQERIDAERLKSPATVASQLNNRPGEDSGNPIEPHHTERSLFQSLDDIPKQAFNWITLHADLAIKSPAAAREGRGDWTVLQLWGHYDGHVYMFWSWRGRPTPEEFDSRLLSALKFALYGYPRARVRLMTYDKPVGQGSAGSYSKQHFESVCADAGMGCPRIHEINRSGSVKMDGKKFEGRVFEMAPFWAAGLVHLLEGSPCTPEIIDQVLHPTAIRHDDDADAACDVVHEKVYMRKMRRRDNDSMPDGGRWTPTPAVHGEFDRHGHFKPTPAKRGRFHGRRSRSRWR